MHQEIQIFSALDQDIFMSQLRSQIHKLNTIIFNLENQRTDFSYAAMLVKEIEKNLRRIRKTWLEN
ncbi:MAG TPA: hypothetical protein PLO93_05255 [Candidatus Omnitrophota bacterium]|nr:hypothetical protein [Candidatus Omnitrophota bacterium]HQL41682.1 hypothetical protein [Candidatus Omnitrophota bacterium]